MNPQLRKRLEKIEIDLHPNQNMNVVVFSPLNGESDAEYDRRVERWYAGEKVEGQDRLYTGNEIRVMRVVYVPCDRPHEA